MITIQARVQYQHVEEARHEHNLATSACFGLLMYAALMPVVHVLVQCCHHDSSGHHIRPEGFRQTEAVI